MTYDLNWAISEAGAYDPSGAPKIKSQKAATDKEKEKVDLVYKVYAEEFSHARFAGVVEGADGCFYEFHEYVLVTVSVLSHICCYFL